MAIAQSVEGLVFGVFADERQPLHEVHAVVEVHAMHVLSQCSTVKYTCPPDCRTTTTSHNRTTTPLPTAVPLNNCTAALLSYCISARPLHDCTTVPSHHCATAPLHHCTALPCHRAALPRHCSTARTLLPFRRHYHAATLLHRAGTCPTQRLCRASRLRSKHGQ